MAFEDALPCFRAVARLVSENRALFPSLSISLSLFLTLCLVRALVGPLRNACRNFKHIRDINSPNVTRIIIICLAAVPLNNSLVVLHYNERKMGKNNACSLRERVFPLSPLVSLLRSCFSFQLLLLLSFQLQDTVLEKRKRVRERGRRERGKKERNSSRMQALFRFFVQPTSLSTKVNR